MASRVAAGSGEVAGGDAGIAGEVPADGVGGLLEMKFAGGAVGSDAAPVVDAVGGVGVLLDFEDEAAGVDGVDESAGDEDGVAGVDVEAVEKLAGGALGDGFGIGGGIDAGFEAGVDAGAGVGVKDVPAFGFGFAAEAGGGVVVRMDLDAEFLVGVDEFDEEGKAGGGDAGAEEVGAPGGDGLSERGSGEGAVGDGGHAVGAVGDFPGFGVDAGREIAVEVVRDAVAAPEVVFVGRLEEEGIGHGGFPLDSIEGGADDAGGVAELVAEESDVGMVAEEVAADGVGTEGVEFVDVGDAAAEDDDIGVEGVDEVSEGASEGFEEVVHEGDGEGVLGTVGGDDVGEGTMVGMLFVPLALESGAADVGFDATAPPAITGGAEGVDGHVAPFAADGLGAGPDVAVDDESAAAPGAHDDAEDHAVAAGGPVEGFGEGEAVGVVFDAEGALDEAFEVVMERVAVEAEGVGVFEEAGVGGEGAGGSDAEGVFGGASFVEDVAVEGGDAFEDGRISLFGQGGDAAADEDVAVGIEDCAFDLGAAEVDADAMGHEVKFGPREGAR